jgi:hypothetical protein
MLANKTSVTQITRETSSLTGPLRLLRRSRPVNVLLAGSPSQPF